MKMTCINVGYGDSLLLEWDDSVMLIDGGSALESEFEGFPARIRSADYLQKTGIGRIDTLIITHIHEDHVCGLTALFDKADIKQVYIPFPPELFKERKIPDAAPDAPENVRLFARSLKDFTKIMEICRVRKIPVKEIFAGDVLDCAGGARLDVLGPNEKDKKTFLSGLQEFFGASAEKQQAALFPYLDSLSNSSSLLLKFSYEDLHMLLCADNCPSHWDKKVFPQLKNVTVLKLPHHGQRDCVDEEIVKLMPLRYVLTTASSDRRHNSANPDVYKILTKLFADNEKFTLLFSDAKEYPPYFFTEKPFQAIEMSFSGKEAQVKFIRI